jgi:ubiquinone/menaquinone biosynthesis C-methylase UbiE
VFARSAAFYDLIYARKDYAAETEQVHAWIQARKRSPGSTLLDVGCGTGRHLSLLRAHYEVEGLDLDTELPRFTTTAALLS